MAWSSYTAGNQTELTCIKWKLSCHQQIERERERACALYKQSLSFIFAERHLKMYEWVNTFMEFLILWLYSSQFICVFKKIYIFCHVCSIFASLSLSSQLCGSIFRPFGKCLPNLRTQQVIVKHCWMWQTQCWLLLRDRESSVISSTQ